MAEEEARPDPRLCPATAAVVLGKPTEPRGPQPASETPAPLPPVDLLGRPPALLVQAGLVGTTRPAPGAAAPRGPVGVPGRARPGFARSPAP